MTASSGRPTPEQSETLNMPVEWERKPKGITANLPDYEATYKTFDWKEAEKAFDWSKTGWPSFY